MAGIKRIGKGESDRFNIRLDTDVGMFYRRKANETGKTPSEYLRTLLERGYLAESLDEIESRISTVIAAINNAGKQGGKLPTEVLLSIFTTEALLQEIVKDKDQQRLYEAQNIAKGKVQKLLGDLNNGE